MPLDRIDNTIGLLVKTKSDLIQAYDRIEALQTACRGLLGVVSTLSRHPDVPKTLRENLMTSEVVVEAQNLTDRGMK